MAEELRNTAIWVRVGAEACTGTVRHPEAEVGMRDGAVVQAS